MRIFKLRSYDGRWEFGPHTRYPEGDFFISDDSEASVSFQTLSQLLDRPDVYEVTDPDLEMDVGL